jgi:hypothetical protein
MNKLTDKNSSVQSFSEIAYNLQFRVHANKWSFIPSGAEPVSIYDVAAVVSSWVDKEQDAAYEFICEEEEKIKQAVCELTKKGGSYA